MIKFYDYQIIITPLESFGGENWYNVPFRFLFVNTDKLLALTNLVANFEIILI